MVLHNIPSEHLELIIDSVNTNPSIEAHIREEILSVNLQILEISDPEFVELNPDAAEEGAISSASTTTLNQNNNGDYQTQG